MAARTIDEFIAAAPPFARPLIEHWRALVIATVPAAQECIKWGMPHFTVQGKNLTGMGAFKAHCSLILQGAGERGAVESGGGMGHFGKIATMAQMPSDELVRELLVQRVSTIRTGAKRPAQARTAKAEIGLPDDLASALDSQARAFLDGLTVAQQREYYEWIVSAKRPETRARRVAEAAQWLGEGKRRNWKYEKC